ncbi:hypothetical protein Sipo7851_22035 [Streptomyces ipomoeae]|nr:hypothetical protein Sipo7851_22035 [Streptomyces ipomoeae]
MRPPYGTTLQRCVVWREGVCGSLLPAGVTPRGPLGGRAARVRPAGPRPAAGSRRRAGRRRGRTGGARRGRCRR